MTKLALNLWAIVILGACSTGARIGPPEPDGAPIKRPPDAGPTRDARPGPAPDAGPRVDASVAGADAGAACGAVTAWGRCGGPAQNVAEYCDGSQLRSEDCDQTDRLCAVDVCGIGAGCCSQTDYDLKCDELIALGNECAGPTFNAVMWCEQGEIIWSECPVGMTCKVDACVAGKAACCI